MAGPWDQYKDQPSSGPWSKYQENADSGGIVLGSMKDLQRGAGITARAAVEGAASLPGMFADPLINALSSLTGKKFATFEDLGRGAADLFNLAKPETSQERIQSAAVSSLSGGGALGALGKTLQAAGAARPVTAGVGAQLAAAPVQQAAGAAAGGAASQLAAEEGAGAGGQLAAGLVGGLAGARIAAPRIKQAPVQAQAIKDIATAKEAGIDLTTSDVFQPETFIGKWLRSAPEKIPLVGTGPVRAAEQAQRVDAVKTLLRESGVDDVIADAIPDKVMAGLASKRSADLTKYATMKKDVIESINEKGVVPVSKATQEVDSQIADLQSLNAPSLKPSIDLLENFKKSIQNQGLSNIEKLRAQLGADFKAPVLVSARTSVEKGLGKVYGALNDDMGDFIKATGAPRDFNKWKIGNKRLAEMAGELKLDSLKSVLRQKDVKPESVERLLFSQKPSEIRALYNGLDVEGRNNAKKVLLAKAANDATKNGELSPDVFKNSADKLSKSYGIFFNKEESARINGLKRALELSKHAAEASASPATGLQNVPAGIAAVLTSWLGSVGATIAGAAAIGGAGRAYESKAIRDLLTRMSTVEKNSLKEEEIFKRFVSAVQAQQSTTDKKEEQE